MSELAEEMMANALEAQKFTRKHLVVELDFSVISLEELESQADSIDYALEGGRSDENIELLTRIWGSYLGEVLRRNGCGEWVREEADGGSRVALQGPHETVYPHEQMRRRLTEGPDHNLAAYFQQVRDRL
jgi:hypothetical protein